MYNRKKNKGIFGTNTNDKSTRMQTKEKANSFSVLRKSQLQCILYFFCLSFGFASAPWQCFKKMSRPHTGVTGKPMALTHRTEKMDLGQLIDGESRNTSSSG